MKTGLVLLIAILAATAQTPPASPSAKCRDINGRACTAKQVQGLSDAAFAGKRQHEVLALFRELTLASPDGTLKCVQNDGSACTTPQLDQIKLIAADQKLYLNYNSPGPAGKK